MFSARAGESWSPAQGSHRLLTAAPGTTTGLLDGNHILQEGESPTQHSSCQEHGMPIWQDEGALSHGGAGGKFRKAKAVLFFW